jgi:hypothetical protein
MVCNRPQQPQKAGIEFTACNGNCFKRPGFPLLTETSLNAGVCHAGTWVHATRKRNGCRQRQELATGVWRLLRFLSFGYFEGVWLEIMSDIVGVPLTDFCR